MTQDWSEPIVYSEENVKRTVGASAGVYRLSSERDDGHYRPFYVGQAKDLRERLLQHLGDAEPNDCIRSERKKPCSFRIVYVANQADRDKLETATIREHSPGCNTQKR